MKQDGILEFFDGANSPSTTPKGSCLSKKDEDAEVSTQSLYVVRDGFFVKTDEKWEKVRYVEILWVRACRVPDRREEPDGEPSAVED